MEYNATSRPLISLQALSTGYRLRTGERTVSTELSLELARGEVVALMGPNGCGKSTLMQTIAGLIPPLGGCGYIDGKPLARLSERQRARLMSLVLSERIGGTYLSVWDVAATGRYPHLGLFGTLRADDRDVLRRCLAMCRLEGMERRPYDQLSDGEKQRVMIARALAQDTPFILLDEPTAHLDLPSRLDVITMLRALAREWGKGILISTHELDLALRWADKLWLMDESGAVACAAPEELVLSGDVERVFGRGALRFDRLRGEFYLPTSGNRPIALSGSGASYEWTHRALVRLGYSPERADFPARESSAERPAVHTEDGAWTLCTDGEVRRFDRLGALLDALTAP